MTHSVNTARLLISCPDQKGIIAAVAGFVADQGGNILEADQHTVREADAKRLSRPQHSEFFMRVEIELSGFSLDRRTFTEAWTPVADTFQMQWRIYWGDERKRMAILVSQEGHCLSDLLWRWKTGELRADVPLVISNHLDLRDHVEGCGVAFHYLPVTNETRIDQERQLSDLLAKERIDFIVLARYMQVLTPSFVAQYTECAINIHHSFLPAFAGPKPYTQAFERGVKIIGATSHYVTDALDQGPIISQATIPVDHRDTLEDMIRKGRDLERVVLAEAVRSHIEDEILVSQNKTVVFH